MKKPFSTDLADTSNNLIPLPRKPGMPDLPVSKPIAATVPALPTDAPPDLSSEQWESLEKVKKQAVVLRDFSFGSYPIGVQLAAMTRTFTCWVNAHRQTNVRVPSQRLGSPRRDARTLKVGD